MIFKRLERSMPKTRPRLNDFDRFQEFYSDIYKNKPQI